MSDKYFGDDFLEFVAHADGRTFKQGSRQHEFKRMITEVELDRVIDAFANRIEKLEKRIAALERKNLNQAAKEDEWQVDEWGNFRLPPPNN